MERGTTSARNCGINPGADWGWKHWTTGDTDGLGRGHVRDRGARAGGQGQVRGRAGRFRSLGARRNAEAMRLRRSGRIPDCSDSRLDQCGQAGRDETGSLLDSCRTGAQVDEAALVEALRTRRIAGAALDVFDGEPLPPESPPWSLENLLLTPPTSGLTDKLWHRHYELLSDHLRRYLEHKQLPFVVDKGKGY